jgi:hypothetical protein
VYPVQLDGYKREMAAGEGWRALSSHSNDETLCENGANVMVVAVMSDELEAILRGFEPVTNRPSTSH